MIRRSILIVVIIGMMMLPNAFAVDENYQIDSTTNKKLDVMFFTVPDHPNPAKETKLKIEFLKPNTRILQEHIDYKVSIEKQVKQIFETDLTHTSAGSVTIPFVFDENGTYEVYVKVEGILFSPIPVERAIFSVEVGSEPETHNFEIPEETSIPVWIKNNAGWWAQGKISDSDFISGIQYLITNGIMAI